jgi:hypothetical protein
MERHGLRVARRGDAVALAPPLARALAGAA